MTDDIKVKIRPHKGLATTGLLCIILIVIIAVNFKKITNIKEPPIKTLLLITALGLAIGVYGTLNLGLEKMYSHPKKLFTKKIIYRDSKNQKKKQPTANPTANPTAKIQTQNKNQN